MLKIPKILLLLIFSFSLFRQVSAQTPTAKDLFDKGLQLVKDQKFNEALEAFRQSAKLDPPQAAAHGNIGTTLLVLNRAAEAIPPFREAVKLAPDDGTFHTALCQALSLTKNHAEAVAQCAEGVRLNGEKVEAHAALITASQIANRPADEILRLTETALGKFPDNENLSNAAAALYAGSGDISRAAAIYEKLAQASPKSAFYQVKLADLYLRLERDAEALAAARKAIEIEPKNAAAYYFSGRIYFELGQHEEAADAFRKVVELDSKNSDAVYLLGLSEIRRGKAASGIAALRQAAAAAPENFDYHKELGSALIGDAQYETAIVPLKKAVALKPKDFEAVAALGTALGESGRFEESLPVLSEADRMKPGSEIINMLLNVTRARLQMTPQIEAMKSYAKENPADLNVRLHLIQHLTYARRIAEAAPYFDEIWKMNPPDPRVYSLIGVLHSTTGNYAKAAEAYRKLLEIGGKAEAYLGLANIYAKNGQIDEAVKAYDQAFELKPDAPHFMKLYADLLRDNGKRREALAMYQRSLTMLPNNAPALFNAGVLSAKLGDLNAAQIYLNTLKVSDPKLAKTLGRFLKLPR